jgi:uncharacterized protein (TIGR02453 family)
MEFFEGLLADNSKDYWQENKQVYEECVRAPMEDLLADLEAEFGAGKIFRPYRDVRFSNDKSPYKTNIAATLAEGGYISLSADALGVGCGLYMPEAAALDGYRKAVADDRRGAELTELVRKLRAKKIGVAGHDALKTAPRGYPKDHPRIDLLRQKGLVAWREWPVGPWLATRQPEKRIVEFLHATEPLRDWLDRNTG